MLLGWEQAKPPDPPNLVNIGVSGTNSVVVKIQEPLEGSLVTKFKSNMNKFLKKFYFTQNLITKSNTDNIFN